MESKEVVSLPRRRVSPRDEVFDPEVLLALAFSQRAANRGEVSGEPDSNALLQSVDQPGRARERVAKTSDQVFLRRRVE